jgi:hypothetical protein
MTEGFLVAERRNRKPRQGPSGRGAPGLGAMEDIMTTEQAPSSSM